MCAAWGGGVWWCGVAGVDSTLVSVAEVTAWITYASSAENLFLGAQPGLVNTMNQVLLAVNAIQQQMASMQATTGAQFSNLGRRGSNEKAFSAIRNFSGDAPARNAAAAAQQLTPLVKQDQPPPGAPAGPLPGGVTAPLGLAAVAGLGVGNVMPSSPFPATVAAAEALTGPELNLLAIGFDNHFGIVAADAVGVRREKFITWIRRG